MSRRPLLAGNWKMHLTTGEAVSLATAVAEATQDHPDRDVMIAPPFTALSSVSKALKNSAVILAGQNVAWERQGAFTGDISAEMLADVGATMAIIGHSERRHVFGEDDTMINRRVLGALQGNLIPVLCIGETLAEREDAATLTVLENQVRKGLAGVSAEQAQGIVVAYEPVWAIGTGKTASTDQAQEAHQFIRELLARMYEKTVADQIRILYGGSVNPDNVDKLMAQSDIDGALVGGAALKAESFRRIIQFQI